MDDTTHPTMGDIKGDIKWCDMLMGMLDPTHQWIDGPDGPNYHCRRCGISRCDDHDAYPTCVAYLERFVTDRNHVIDGLRRLAQWAT